MVEELNEGSFSTVVNTIFKFEVAPAQTVELKLVEVHGESSGMPKAEGQERFALYFVGPGESFLPQKSYPVRHEQIGDFEIFLVPIAREADGFRYEAVFNRVTT